ncbi:helix-turn-helix domain-containing protein [Lactiplantibacillus plantarum]|uniref:helix-turn-helix domain-containing protein n=1 Tax=Lactiplantibacillus plantarum TaxID=1590 RepID=UPI001BA66C2B|nr:helix-turn-helix transcriptional regulator [Lactiplantibacillus plantarum]MBS0937560.1 helix-turn-helix transcriptional regulator [Lactiplantibacillus plantarum]MBS0944146.1 helix-turn-helix transcriptional regulator [Lactiplantibacillus plantarum]
MKNDSKIVGQRIVDFLKDRDITVHRLSVKSGVPNTTLVDLINGTTKSAKLSTIISVCSALGISVHDFFDFPPYNEVEK